MKQIEVPLCLLVVLSLFQCSPRNCYEIKLQFGTGSNLKKDSPILIGDGIVGYVEEMLKNKDGSEVRICIPNPVRIPKDSKLAEGYIDRFGDGIQITLGSQAEFLDRGDTMVGIHIDTIKMETTNADSAVVKKIIEIANDFAEKQKKKKKKE
jgi:hypothetical protein